MTVQFTNNAATNLSADISASATSITVADASEFPTLSGSGYTYATFSNLAETTIEVVKVTAISGNTLTVVRGQDNTTAASFASGDKCELRVTAALLNDIATQADTDTNTEYTAGSGITLTGTVFSNSAPDQTVSLTGSGGTTVSGTYPNFTISSAASIDGTTINPAAVQIGGTTVIDSSRNLANLGTISASGLVTADRFFSGVGTVASPAYKVGDTDSGFYDSGSNMVGVALGGVLEYDFQPTKLDMKGNQLDNVGNLQVDVTSSNGVRVTGTDSVADAAFTTMLIDHNASGSTALTADRSHIGLAIDMDSTATGGDTSNEHRLYGIHNSVKATGDSDLIYGVYSAAEAEQTAGQVSALYGGFFQATGDVTGGTLSTSYGVYGFNSVANASGTTITNNYALYGRTLVGATQDSNVNQAVGVYGEVEIDPSGASTTLSSAHVFQAQFDNDSGGDVTINTGYLYYGNYAGTLPTAAYGVYIVDGVRNYFGGSLTAGLGSTTTASYGFNGDLNTGMYSPANHEVALLANGTQRLNVNSSGAQVTGSVTSTGSVTATAALVGASADISGAISSATDSIRTANYSGGTGLATQGEIMIRSGGKTGWAPGDELGKISFYQTDGSGVGPGYQASIRVVNNNGNGSTTTISGAEIHFYTSAYNTLETYAAKVDSANFFDSAAGYKVNGTTVIDSSRNLVNIGTLNGGTPFTTANDGSGSGLDADTLDGYQAQGSSGNRWGMIPAVLTSGVMEIGRYIDFHASDGSTEDHRVRLDGGTSGQLYLGSNQVWHAGNDGSGSGLDADLLDGQHGSYYAQFDHFRSTGNSNYTSTTTSALASEAFSDGAMKSYLTSHKTGWSYGGNGNLQDAGRLTELAGTSWLWWTDNSSDSSTGNYTALCIAPNTGGSSGKMFVYNNQGSSYAPGWREIWTSTSDGSGSGLDADTVDGVHASSLVRSDSITYMTSSGIGRNDHHLGHLIGSYNNVGANGQKTNPIYSIGSSYLPSATSFSNHYGIGYANSTIWGTASGKPAGWGMYVTENGTIRGIMGIGGTWSQAEFNRNGNKVWDAGNDGSGSGLDADTCDGQHLGTTANPTFNTVRSPGANADVRLSVWSGVNYGIGMTSGVTLGHLNDYAMTFCMNNDGGRGFWWGYSGQAKSAGAMSLTTDGRLWVSADITTPSLYIGDGTDGRFFSDTAGRTAFASGDFYIQTSVDHYYNYATNQYHGNSSGNTHYFRANVMNGTGWEINGAGRLTTRDHRINAGYHLQRLDHHSGHLEGSYNNVGGNSLNSNPIYTIGSGYNPASTTLGNMYGIGYSNANASFIGFAGSSGWGMYVAADGDARIYFSGSQGHGYFTGNVTAYASDRRLKTNIQSIDNALDKVSRIRGVEFDWVDDITSEYDFHPQQMHETGVIAQEIQEVIPDAVVESPMNGNYTAKCGTDHKFLTVDKEKIVPLLIEAVKELKAEVDALKSQIEEKQ